MPVVDARLPGIVFSPASLGVQPANHQSIEMRCRPEALHIMILVAAMLASNVFPEPAATVLLAAAMEDMIDLRMWMCTAVVSKHTDGSTEVSL